MRAMASKSPASRLFTQPFIQAQIKENIKALRHWPLCANSPATGEFPQKWPVTRKMFPFDDVIMLVQLMVWHRTGASHYLNTRLPALLKHIWVIHSHRVICCGHDCVDYGGKWHQRFQSNGLDMATCARLQLMSRITKAGAWHHIFHANHRHHFSEIWWSRNVKMNGKG